MARRGSFSLVRWGLLLLLALTAGSVEAQTPTIAITSVPLYGSTENLRGHVSGVDLAAYHVAVYLFLEGLGWYVKPTAAAPCTPIAPNGDFEADVTTGGFDHLAHRYAVFLLPVAEACQPTCSLTPVCGVGQCLPGFLPDPLPGRPAAYAERTPSTLQFSGYTWVKRDSPYEGGPESNCFSMDHAAVDRQGTLHLVQDSVPSVGFCGAEVILARSLGYGEYRIHTIGRVDSLDPQAVFGMFTWDPDARPVHRELDIELSRWGVPSDPNAQFVLQPYCDYRDRFPLALTDGASELTLLMNWAPGEVTFSAYHGHHFGVPPPADLIHQKVFASGVPEPGRERFRFNLWRFCTGACTLTQRQEVVVTYFGHVPTPRRFNTVSPCRLVDTRNAVGPRGGPALPAASERTFTMTGQCAIPPTARAVSLNVTVTEPTGVGHLSLYPAGGAIPPTSTINYSANQTRANNAIVAIGDFGQVAVHSGQAAGTTHLILDVNGYFE